MTAPTIATAGALVILDAAYRAAVARSSMNAVKLMLAQWTTVDPRNIAASAPQWIAIAVAAILAAQDEAAGLATAYHQQTRRIVVPDAPTWTAPPRRPPNLEQIRKSVVYTGIISTAQELSRLEASTAPSTEPDDREEGETESPADREATRAGAEKRIMQEGIARAANAAVRHVTQAGFDQMIDNVQNDPVATGWYRTTKAGCCYFCAMLASRGQVYKEDSFEDSNAKFHGPGEHKVHDSCGCGLRAAFDLGEELPERTAEFEKLWIDKASGHSGSEAIKAFRRAYEGREG